MLSAHAISFCLFYLHILSEKHLILVAWFGYISLFTFEPIKHQSVCFGHLLYRSNEAVNLLVFDRFMAKFLLIYDVSMYARVLFIKVHVFGIFCVVFFGNLL